MQANPKLNQLTDYPFDRLRRLLDGIEPTTSEPPISLSLGEPQHKPPQMITEVLSRHHDLWRQYPPVDGIPDWREACFSWIKRRYGVEATGKAELGLLPASGTREILFMVAQALMPESKRGMTPLVVMPNPFYQVYLGAAIMNGAKPHYLDATPENDFMPPLSAVDPAILEQTALVYLCSPANPQGSAADITYWQSALTLARRYDFVLLADECYSELYFGTPPSGALEAAKALGDGFDNLLVFHSLSKRSNAAGLRSGFVAGDPKLVQALRHLRTYAAASVPVPIQKASAALWADDEHVHENRALYAAKFDAAGEILGTRFGYYKPDGGFFLWLDVGDGEKAAQRLWQEGALRVLPGGYITKESALGNPGTNYIRLALVHDLTTSVNALNRLVKIL